MRSFTMVGLDEATTGKTYFTDLRGEEKFKV